MTEAKIEGTSVTLTHHANAPIERVFKAFTDGDELSKWFGPEDHKISSAEMDPRMGGAYRLAIDVSGGEIHTVRGVIKELVEPSLIVYTWSWEEDDAADEHESLVTIRFAAAAGGTDIELIHTQLASPESAERHTSGWSGCLIELDRYLA